MCSNMPTCHFGENSKQVLSRLVPLGKMIYLGHILCNRYKCGARYDFMKLFFFFFKCIFTIRCPWTASWQTAVLSPSINLDEKKEDAKIRVRVKEADGRSSLFSHSQALNPTPLPLIYIQGFCWVYWNIKHRQRNPAKLSFPLFLDCTSPYYDFTHCWLLYSLDISPIHWGGVCTGAKD